MVNKLYDKRKKDMLEISNIKKDYQLKDETVNALKGVDICFRRSEFVSILGPSGCGKTTLLNIIGGLDRYTDGDLIVDGISTKQFKDKDWDNYRNHRVGFVFQSYNLIPHQTVLQNVELALTLSGVSKKERHERAVEVLKKVGLGDKLKSRPNQLSGGQMQRVAIARALVNDPEIILADEPTGALDSKTSVQIMELLKEVSQNKLVIMVTHNPELAEQYSSRIIRLLDGELIEDTLPYTQKQAQKDLEKYQTKTDAETSKFNKTKKKKSMSFFTALSLSFKNLLTKKARTILVAFAGSIGIIGIALVLAISSGFSGYINKVQEEVLASTPITIQAKSMDITSIISDMILDSNKSASSDHENDGIYPKESITKVLESVSKGVQTNDLTKFRAHLELDESKEKLKNDVNAIQYTYNLPLEFHTEDANKTNYYKVQPNNTSMADIMIKYAVFFLGEKSSVTVTEVEPMRKYRLESTANTTYGIFNYLGTNFDTIKTQLQTTGTAEIEGTNLTNLVTTILGVDPAMFSGSSSPMAMMGVDTSIFNEMINNEKVIKQQYTMLGDGKYPTKADEALLVLDKNHELDEYVLYALGLLNDEDMNNILKASLKGDDYTVKIDYSDIIGKTSYNVLTERDYFFADGEGGFDNYNDKEQFNEQQKNEKLKNEILPDCANKITIVGVVRLKDDVSSGYLKSGIAYTDKLTQQMLLYHNESEAIDAGLLEELSIETPDSIKIFINSFESKEVVQEFIEDYNAGKEESEQIKYSDTVGMIMGAVSTIINAITYILIAFVSVSLVVSSIMIGIITYISVIERTKEIGVLRSVGASKRDIKRVFTAESFIIGLTSGVFGILVTLLAILPINIIIKSFTGIAGLAVLPWLGALILIGISVLLTFIAGLFPAHIASKKDPVIALRTE